jgi:rubredoxin
MARYECSVCSYVHDESKEGNWNSLPGDWTNRWCRRWAPFYAWEAWYSSGPPCRRLSRKLGLPAGCLARKTASGLLRCRCRRGWTKQSALG